MRLRLWTILLVFLLIPPLGAIAEELTLEEKALETVTIHAFSGMPLLPPEDEWPEIMKRFPKYDENISGADLIRLDYEISEWIFAKYYGESKSFFFGKTGVIFSVYVPEYDYTFPILMVEYILQDGKLYLLTKKGKEESDVEDFLKLKNAWAWYIVASILDNLEEPFFDSLHDDVIMKHEEILKELGVLGDEDSLSTKLTEVDTPLIKAEEILFVPKDLEFADFAPNEVMIYPMLSAEYMIHGVSYTGTGLVAFSSWLLTKQASIPSETAKHEFLHKSPLQNNLLSYPLPFFPGDKETWAFFIQKSTGRIRLIFHPYAEPCLSAIKVMTGLDVEYLYREGIKRAQYSRTELNDEVWNQYINDTDPNKVDADSIYLSFREALYEKFLANFYLDPLYWLETIDTLYDNNAPWKVGTALMNFYPTLLGGRKETQKAILEDWEIIIGVYREVKKELAKQNHNPDVFKISSRDLTIKEKILDDPEMVGLLRMVMILCGINEVNKMDDERLVETALMLWKQGLLSIPQFQYRKTQWRY